MSTALELFYAARESRERSFTHDGREIHRAQTYGDKNSKRWWQTKREERGRGKDEAAKREVEDDGNSRRVRYE